ncbi:hypothetical protein OE749_08585 [Aestuariibacter sp. AA17]|uniref:Uncharacterized protein n=1 Tax=Fluctibacter corallii TaxID=2984329 RepID=A0ABT3A7T3_9ALTE|nr:hypothetical protein [Aestuariibacter sp. AA17]MCV2884751.1 hypothetical protein [Aestuariibacter sp. AA17]
MTKTMKLGALFFTLWVVFQGAYLSGKFYQHAAEQHRLIDSIEKRIALDLPKLRIANPRLKTVTHEGAIRDYLHAVNAQLTAMKAPMKIATLQGIWFSDTPINASLTTRVLSTPDQDIHIQLVPLPVAWSDYLSFIAPLLALALAFIHQTYFTSTLFQEEDTPTPEPEAQVRLVVNLNEKVIGNGVNDYAVSLSNKPFCFYAALVDYCIQHESPSLNHNKNVPEELVNLANRYFFRLIELGHTKRKKPDFSTNLDKTLSEIRAALDEVYVDHPDIKELFYPPKAQGEGSRSKMHNYALEKIQAERVEFIGK